MSDDLKSFKIADAVKKTVDGPRPQKKEETPPTSSVGFPRIEALVEMETPDLAGLQERLAALSELAKGTGPAKTKSQAKKAALAYEKTLALVEHLLETKKKMQDATKAPAA